MDAFSVIIWNRRKAQRKKKAPRSHTNSFHSIVSERDREEPQICMQSAERKIPPNPKALVIGFTRKVTGSRSKYPLTVPKPTSFSYQSNKAVP